MQAFDYKERLYFHRPGREQSSVYRPDHPGTKEIREVGRDCRETTAVHPQNDAAESDEQLQVSWPGALIDAALH